MIATARLLFVAAAVAALTFGAQPARAQSTSVPVTGNVKKPLEISRVADMTFGTIMLSGAASFTADVTIAQNGTFTCPAALICTGTTSPATYNVSGNKQSPVQINVPATMTLTGPYGTITMTTSAPTTVILTNSGYPGTNFNIGGTLRLTNDTKDGLYTGTFSVTADYQ